MNEAMNLVRKVTVPCCSRLTKVLAWIALLTAFLVPNLHAQTNCLGRTFTKLRAGQPVTIAYFGGSITAGVGSSNDNTTSYRALMTQWFQSTYPNSTITMVNAAVGGTGSYYGSMRCQRDVLSHNPDLVVVEFALNDILTQNNTDFEIDRQVEGIIRQIMAANANTEILFFYTGSSSFASIYASGQTPHSIVDYTTIGNAYGIGQLNIGLDVQNYINTGAASWNSLTTDGTHPNDTGYALYFSYIKPFLVSHQNDTTEPAYTIHSGLSTNPILGSTVSCVTQLPIPSTGGWTTWGMSASAAPDDGYTPSVLLYNNTVGATYTYSFTGTDIAISGEWTPDGANVSYSVDGGAYVSAGAMTEGGIILPSYILMGENLANTSHTVVLQINAAGGSATGTAVHFDSMLVYGTTNGGSGGSSAPAQGLTYVNDTDPGITYQANQWGYSSGRGFGDYDNDVHYAGGNGAYASYTFTGTGIAYLTETATDEGHVNISIDGGTAFQVECNTTTRVAQENAYSIQGLTYGTHTITITKVDGNVMLLDGFIVYNLPNMVNDNSTSITYQANQFGYSSGRGFGDFDNDVHYAGGNGAYASYTFNGIGVAVITETASDQGHINVSIDGGAATQVNTNSVNRTGSNVVYLITGLANGSHTVTVTKVDGSIMTIDAFAPIAQTFTPTSIVNDTSSAITYSGTWNYSSGRGYGDYSNDVHYTSTNGASASYTFTGTGVAFITETYSDEGHVNVQIDGGTAVSVNCVSTTRTADNMVYIVTGLTSGNHTITVTKVDGTYMLLDGFAVYAPLDPPTYVNDTDPTIVYGGSWSYAPGRGYGDFMDDCHVCGNNNTCTASYTWTGTGIVYLTETASDEGHVNVSIDGGTATQVNCLTSTRAAQVQIFSKLGMAPGSHTITITKIDGSFMLLDGFIKF